MQDEQLTPKRKISLIRNLPAQRAAFQEDIKKMRQHLIAQGKDPELCPEDALWIAYEGRPDYMQGAHAGNIKIERVRGNLFVVVSWRPKKDENGELVKKDGETVYEKFLPSYSSSTGQVSTDGSGSPLYLKAIGNSMIQVNKMGIPVNRGHKIPLGKKNTAKLYNENGELKENLTTPISLSMNEGAIGIVIAGSYTERKVTDEHDNFGYQQDSLLGEKMPEPAAVDLTIDVLNKYFQSDDYPKLREILAHRSGFFNEHVNCVGGTCPGKGAMPLVRFLKRKYDR